MSASSQIRPTLDLLRQRIPALRTVEGGGASLEIALARVDRPETAAARLLEDAGVTAHPVPTGRPPAITAFLDGVQESHEVAYLGTVPIVFGRVAAVIRQRADRRLSTWREAHTRSAVYAPWSTLPQRERALFQEHGLHTREVGREDGPNDPHPWRGLQEASNAVKQDREALERDLAAEYCADDPGTLYLDGGLPSADAVHASDRVVGVVKSHQTLYVAGAGLGVVMGLAEGERSSVFAVESRRRPAVASWYLRLRDASGRDPFWGLVRVEVPLVLVEQGGPEVADERSAWVFAERAPVALPDGRWDTMAYGIRNCEEFLRATLGG